MSGRYAADTQVTPTQTLEDIKRTLTRFGATAFGYHEDRTGVGIMFEIDNLRVALRMSNPDRAQFELNSYGHMRAAHVIEKDVQQALRSRWRVLHLAVKAKLALIEEGISTVEREFMPDIILPNGVSIADYVQPVITEARKFQLGEGSND